MTSDAQRIYDEFLRGHTGPTAPESPTLESLSKQVRDLNEGLDTVVKALIEVRNRSEEHMRIFKAFVDAMGKR